MNGYNSNFTMPDFFSNPSLGKVFPQFTPQEINLPSEQLLSDSVIYNKVAEYLSTALGAERTAKGITVTAKFDATVTKLRALASVCEGIFSSSESVAINIKSKSKVYTTMSTIDRLKELDGITQRLAYMNQVLENINYNKDFNSLGSVALLERNNTKATFERRQMLWENKVGYTQDPKVKRMNAGTKWQR